MLTLSDSPIELLLPLYSSRVAAGFPGPADDYLEAKQGLNARLSRSNVVRRPYPTGDTRQRIQALRQAEPLIFKPGLPYCQVGVGLIELTSGSHQRRDLLGEQQPAKSQRLMQVVDRITIRWHRRCSWPAMARTGRGQ